MKNSLTLFILCCLSAAVPLPASAQNNTAMGTKRALLIGISHYIPPESRQRFIPPTYKVDSRFNPGMSWVNLPASLDDVQRMSTQLLENLYGFEPAHIKILPEDQATHDGILHALDQLVAETIPGDTVVFYFSGHGSQRLDSLSSKNKRDQTIVPIDAWQGIPDVRDKDLAVRFNQIVYDKKAHLTAIFDSCESATQGRGIVPVISHALAYDDRDVATEKQAHPNEVVVESDLKQTPQKGNAVILAAAGPERSAFEARFDDDGEWHGVFTRALIHTLKTSPQLRSADDVMRAVQAQIEADNQEHPELLFQQVSLEGKHDQSLFGDPLPPHPLHATITAAPELGDEHPVWKLEPGSAGGFAAGSEFVALDAKAGANRTVLRIISVDGPSSSTAERVTGDADVRVGQIFELQNVRYPKAAQLTVFLSAPMSDASPTAVQALFPSLQWVTDPGLQPIDYLVVHEDRGWVAYKEDGTVVPAKQPITGHAYLVLPPPASLINQMRNFQPYVNHAYTFTSKLVEANYIFAVGSDAAQAQYALIDPVVLAPREPGAFVHSPTAPPPEPGEHEDIDLRLSRRGDNEALCRNDISLPVRSAWLHEDPAASECDGLAFALTRRIVRLGKVRSLLTQTAQAPALTNWPYSLTLAPLTAQDSALKLPLHSGSTFQISLKADQAVLDAHAPDRKYLYLFGANCAGDLNVYYPAPGLNGVGEQPTRENNHWQSNLILFSAGSPGIGYPLGADTFFLMALPEQRKLMQPEMVTEDGSICTARSRGAFADMNTFLSDLNKENAKAKQESDWTMQQMVVPSRTE